jgi:hypothetical protein
MLIDYVGIEKLPHIIVWLDWNLYAYWPSLLVSLVVFSGWLVYAGHPSLLNWSGLSAALFSAMCAWVVWCAIRYGYGIG